MTKPTRRNATAAVSAEAPAMPDLANASMSAIIDALAGERVTARR